MENIANGQAKLQAQYTLPSADEKQFILLTEKKEEGLVPTPKRMGNYLKLLLLSLLVVYSTQTYAQLDSIQYRVETQAAISSQGYLPLWIVSNRFGVLDDENDALVRAGFEVPYTKGKKFDVSYGLDIVGKKNLGNSRLQQGFLKVKYGIFELRGGRIEKTTGMQYDELSSGSLAQSRNAMPIPKIAITVPEYASVPFTKGYFEFKGYWGHGWLGEERHVKNSYLHEKNLYVKFGGNFPVNLFGGFVHYAMWGGEHPTQGEIPANLKDYLLVFQGKEATKESMLPGEVGNALGNHLGIYDFGIVANIQNYKVSLYHQTPWEDLTSLKLFKSQDRMLGVKVNTGKKNKLVSQILYEYLYTKYQSGPGLPDPIPRFSHNFGYPYGGRDDYYNNYLYNSGWTYRNMIIGTPLFTTKIRAEKYFNSFEDYGYFSYSIVNNRVLGHHLGIEGYFGKSITYRAKATYTQNYGTYTGLNLGRYNWASMDPNTEFNYEFDPYLHQLYLLLEFNTLLPFNKNITCQTAVGYDVGELSRNFGVLLGLKWNGRI